MLPRAEGVAYRPTVDTRFWRDAEVGRPTPRGRGAVAARGAAWGRRGGSRRLLARVLLAFFSAAATAAQTPSAVGTTPGASAQPLESAESGGYREPGPAVVRLLTAARPPEPLLHGSSRQLALLHRQTHVAIAQLARPFLGLAGYRFDPVSRLSGAGPRIARIEILDLAAGAGAPIEWRPDGGALLEDVRFSPNGRHLSALAVGAGPARLVLFDRVTRRERTLPVPVNPAWGSPCDWLADDALLCRLLPEGPPPIPSDRPVPEIVEHWGGPAPGRTYSNLLDSTHEEALFEHYFAVELGTVGLDGSLRRIPGLRGLLSTVEPSPNGELAVVTRIERPFSRLVPARRFPRSLEVWDLKRAARIRAHPVPETEGIRQLVWKPGRAATLGWVERTATDEGDAVDRWRVLAAPFSGEPLEIARSPTAIASFGWTSEGTPWFVTRSRSRRGTQVRIHVVMEDGVREIWSGSTEDRYGNPGRALRMHGDRGAVIERDGRVFLASDGLGPAGPQPYLDALDLRTLESERLFVAREGEYEPVLGVLDAAPPWFITSRETERDPPAFFTLRGEERTLLRSIPDPYPDLARCERRVVAYKREDGVELGATLYLPARAAAGPLPTLVWIYPREFSDPEYAEQVDARRYRFHEVRGPSPLAVLLEGYALLLSPTMPIIGEAGRANDEYLSQLVANAEAAVRYLVSEGIADPDRIAIGGRSYGAFSSANLLAHTQLFRTGIALSGAYNRTLTPFGFQSEKRSFWKATDLYTRISPFFYADSIEEPLLLIHGGADPNAGTPPLQARRFFHALVGNGVPVRYVELPHEGHEYWARESVLHIAAELIDWLGRTLGSPPGADSATPAPRVGPS